MVTAPKPTECNKPSRKALATIPGLVRWVLHRGPLVPWFPELPPHTTNGTVSQIPESFQPTEDNLQK